jgi:hypothetical protein
MTISFRTDLAAASQEAAVASKPVLLFLTAPGCTECAEEIKVWQGYAPLAPLIAQTIPCTLSIYTAAGPPTQNPVTKRFIAPFEGGSLPVQGLLDGKTGKVVWLAAGFQGGAINTLQLQGALKKFKPS